MAQTDKKTPAGLNVYLIGFMGSGKTAAGRALAKKLGVPFADTDLLIRKLSGLGPAAFIKKRGLRSFRRAERSVFRAAARSGGRVIALGGGLMPIEPLRPLFKKSGITVCLECGETVLFKRLKKNLSRRPLLGGGPEQARRAIKRLLKKRRPYYRRADLTVNTSDLRPEKTAEKIKKLLKL